MAPILQADLEALQQFSADLYSQSDAIITVDTLDEVADAYRFLSGRISGFASGVAATSRLLEAAERDFTDALHRIQF